MGDSKIFRLLGRIPETLFGGYSHTVSQQQQQDHWPVEGLPTSQAWVSDSRDNTPGRLQRGKRPRSPTLTGVFS